MKIAIAFGFGKESMDMVEMFLHKKPILIFCDCERYDVDSRTFRAIGKCYGLKTIIINTKNGFQECWTASDGFFKNGYDVNPYPHYSNAITRYYKKHKKPFDILYVGRRRKDLKERAKHDWWWLKKLKPKIKGVEFPLWNK